tara:strand:+ start:12340 stop:13584 length:1245 start_codon:yes stop_codon:yes gene_type:complete
MANPDDSAFAVGLTRIGIKGHSYGSTSPRKKLAVLQSKQFPDYDPNSGVAYELMRRRNPGRKLTPYMQMGQEGLKSPQKPSQAFAREGKAYVPTHLPPDVRSLGRPLAINHEFEHAYSQPRNDPRSVSEVAPVLGDIVFGAESFRRQAGKPVTGKIPYGFKNQDVEWMRSQAQKHGYFDGRSMTDLLRTPEGISYLRQAALGPKAYADNNSPHGEFDPLAARGDLPLPADPVQLPPLPNDGYIPKHILNPDLTKVKRQSMLNAWEAIKKKHEKTADKRALRATFPPREHPRPTVLENDTSTFLGRGFGPRNERIAQPALEQARKHVLRAVDPYRFHPPEVTGPQTSNPYLDSHERIRYPGQDIDTIAPRQNGNIRSLLKKYEDDPMGGYSTPTQSILFPFYRRNQGLHLSLPPM